MKRNWWQIIIIILLVLIMAMLATFLVLQQKNKHIPPPPIYQEPGARGVPDEMRDRRMSERFEQLIIEEFEIDSTQKDTILKFRNDFHEQMKNLMILKRKAEKKLMDKAIQDTINPKEIDSITEEIGRVYGEQQKLKLNYLRFLRSQTNQEHHAKVDSLFKKMIIRENKMNPGRRNQHKNEHKIIKPKENENK